MSAYGTNLAVRCPQREGPFSDGERKSVGRVPCFPLSAESGRPIRRFS